VIHQTRSLPLAAADVVDSALALVCSLPADSRHERRISMNAVVSQATSRHELENGVSFLFENSDDIARSLFDLVLAERHCCAQFRYSILFAPEHQPIELRVEAAGPSVWLLKKLFARSDEPPATESKTERKAQSLPTASSKRTRVLGSVGMLACIVGCLGFPGFTAALSALGLGFFRANHLPFARSVPGVTMIGAVIGATAVIGIVIWDRRQRKRSAR
jgi:hypothetical protein